MGIALVFGMEYSDRSFRNVEDAASYLKLPILGSIPTIVSPLEVARRRRRKLAIAGLALMLLLATGGAVFLLEHLYPGMAKDKLSELYLKLNTLMTAIRDHL